MKKIKNLLLLGMVVLMAASLSVGKIIPNTCYYTGEGYELCVGQLAGIIFYFAFSTFLILIISYLLSDKVFRTWLHFSYWWLPLSLILALLTPQDGAHGFGPSFGWNGGATALVLASLFTIISLLIIVVSYFKDRKRKSLAQNA